MHLKRPKPYSTSLTELPYGLWRCANGTEVLFNRRYQPVWRRHSAAPASGDIPEPDEWIAWTEQHWFCRGDTYFERPMAPEVRNGLQMILAGFKEGRPMEPWLGRTCSTAVCPIAPGASGARGRTGDRIRLPASWIIGGRR